MTRWTRWPHTKAQHDLRVRYLGAWLFNELDPKRFESLEGVLGEPRMGNDPWPANVRMLDPQNHPFGYKGLPLDLVAGVPRFDDDA